MHSTAMGIRLGVCVQFSLELATARAEYVAAESAVGSTFDKGETLVAFRACAARAALVRFPVLFRDEARKERDFAIAAFMIVEDSRNLALYCRQIDRFSLHFSH